jgi:hypothetical protein
MRQKRLFRFGTLFVIHREVKPMSGVVSFHVPEGSTVPARHFVAGH